MWSYDCRAIRVSVKLLLATVTAATAAACASSGAQEGPPSVRQRERVPTGVNSTMELTHDAVLQETVFTVSRDEVWKALLMTHDEIGVPVQQARPKENTMIYFAPDLGRTFLGKRLSRYFDCGLGPAGQPRADTYRLSLKITELLDSVGAGQIRLRTEAQANARTEALSSGSVRCQTTKQLEKQIAAMVAAKLK